MDTHPTVRLETITNTPSEHPTVRLDGDGDAHHDAALWDRLHNWDAATRDAEEAGSARGDYGGDPTLGGGYEPWT